LPQTMEFQGDSATFAALKEETRFKSQATRLLPGSWDLENLKLIIQWQDS
jgi:hypothetical protein